jgi:DNA-binding NarL/FixJ family response regulator
MQVKVLVADDHGIVRAGLCALLAAQPELLIVGEAITGRMAVSETLRLRPDVVVLDIAMPELSGIEAARQIHSTLPAVAIVILSMYATREHVTQALKAGARGYVLKGAPGNELIEGIIAAHAGQRYLSAKIPAQLIDDLLLAHAQATPAPLEQLSAREREILQLVVEGKTSLEISQIVALSPKTVETYRSRLMQKLGIEDLPTLVKFALQQGITTLD